MENHSNDPNLEFIRPLNLADIPACECPHCGRQHTRTLTNQLHDLAENFGLSEVLDRLASMSFTQTEMETDPKAQKLWGALVRQLEICTELSLAIANSKPHGAQLWR